MNKYTDFSSIEKYKNHEQLEYLQHMINYSISKTLPLLTKEENAERLIIYTSQEPLDKIIKERKTMNSFKKDINNENKAQNSQKGRNSIFGIKENTTNYFNNNKSDKERKLDFWNKIKKKYASFKELKLIEDNDYINILYKDYIYYDENIKNISKNFYFDYYSFLYKSITKTADEQWTSFINKKLKLANSNILENYEGYWLNCVFNVNSITMNNALKYNLDLSCNSVIITVDLFYNNLSHDIYILLKNRPSIERIILQIEQRSYWVGNDIDPIYYIQDYEWNNDINNIINVFLCCVSKFHCLKALTITANDDCEVELTDDNTILLCSILQFSYKSIEVFTMNKIRLIEKNYIMTHIINSISLKILIIQGSQIILSSDEKSTLDNLYGLNKNIIYFRFRKDRIYSDDI
jgi:hypothetical protein